MYIHVITYSWFHYKGPDQAYTVVRISLPIQSQLDLIIFIKSSCRNPWNCETLGPGVNPDQLEL